VVRLMRGNTSCVWATYILAQGALCLHRMNREKEDNGTWTIPALKEYFEARINGNDLRYEQRFTAQEAASKYAQEKANEFRGSLEDIGKNQMPRTEAEAMLKAAGEKTEALAKANSERISALQARIDRTEGRSGGLSAGWGYLIGAIGLIGALVAIVLALRK